MICHLDYGLSLIDMKENPIQFTTINAGPNPQPNLFCSFEKH